jgi:hypothetical protein
MVELVEGENGRFLQIERVHPHRAVSARPQRNPRSAVDSQRQHEAVVVVGVFADQVDTPRRARHKGRVGVEMVTESGDGRLS